MLAKRLVGLAILASLLIAACAQPAAPSPQPPAKGSSEYPSANFKFGHPFAQDHLVGMFADRFAKAMEENSGGKVKVEVFHGGAVVSGKTELDHLTNGVVDFGTVTAAYHAGELPFLEEATFVPMLFSYDSLKAVWPKVRPIFEQDLANKKIKLLNTIPEVLGIFTSKPVDPKNPDLTGMKLRGGGGLQTGFLRTYGASTVDMPSPDVPVAIRTGVVQGLSTSLFSWDSLGIMEDAPYAYVPDDDIFFFLFAMNKESFAKLDPKLQELVEQSAASTESWVFDNVRQLESDILKKAEQKPKVKVNRLSKEEAKIWRDKLAPLYADFEKRYGDKSSQYLKLAKEALAQTAK